MKLELTLTQADTLAYLLNDEKKRLQKCIEDKPESINRIFWITELEKVSGLLERIRGEMK